VFNLQLGGGTVTNRVYGARKRKWSDLLARMYYYLYKYTLQIIIGGISKSQFIHLDLEMFEDPANRLYKEDIHKGKIIREYLGDEIFKDFNQFRRLYSKVSCKMIVQNNYN